MNVTVKSSFPQEYYCLYCFLILEHQGSKLYQGVNSGSMSHQQGGHTEKGPRFKVSSERREKREIDLVIPKLVVSGVIHHTTAAPAHYTNAAEIIIKLV